MSKLFSIDEGDVKHAKELLRKTRDVTEMRMAQAVILPALHGMSVEQTGEALGVSSRTVHNLRKRLQRHAQGEDTKDKRGGRRRQKMTIEEERVFLKQWEEKAKKGEIVIGCEIREALSRQLGCEVCESTFYRLLHRHNWRKSAPDTRHPKSDPAVQEAWKKNSRMIWQLFANQRKKKESHCD
jgi:transposase